MKNNAKPLYRNKIRTAALCLSVVRIKCRRKQHYIFRGKLRALSLYRTNHSVFFIGISGIKSEAEVGVRIYHNCKVSRHSIGNHFICGTAVIAVNLRTLPLID